MKIIIADDDKTTRLMLEKVLEKASYTVEIYHDGEEVYEALLNPDSPSIVILDWMMPKLNGPMVLKKLADKHIIQSKYVLMLSSKTNPAEIAEGLMAGASDYLTKPINSFELLARIKVAQRILSYQASIRLYAKKMESLVRRNKLLNKLSTRELLQYSPEESIEESTEATVNISGQNSQNNKAKGLTYILEKLITSTLKHYGLDNSLDSTTVSTEAIDSNTHYTTWIPLFIPESNRWIDFGFSVDIKAATAITNFITNSNESNNQDIIDALAETTNLIESSFKQVLSKSKNLSIYTPYTSRCFLSKELSVTSRNFSLETCEVQVGNVSIKGYLSDTRTLLASRNVFNISIGDVVCQEVLSQKESDTVLINNGTVIDEDMVESIPSWLSSGLIDNSLRITEASKFAQEILSMSDEL